MVFRYFYKLSKAERILDLREFKMVWLACNDFYNKEIADRLHLSEKQVEHIFHLIYQRFGVRDRVGLTRECFKRKILNEWNC